MTCIYYLKNSELYTSFKTTPVVWRGITVFVGKCSWICRRCSIVAVKIRNDVSMFHKETKTVLNHNPYSKNGITTIALP